MTRLTLNDQPTQYRLDPATPLLWALRDASNLTGTKYGCDSGDCGACTVMVDGRATLSCRVAVGTLEGADVVTIEGLANGATHPVQQAWLAEQVTMCGYCEPGFIMAVAALLETSANPTAEQISAIPNICRCGIYPRVIRAIGRALQSAPHAAPPKVPGTPDSDLQR